MNVFSTGNYLSVPLENEKESFQEKIIDLNIVKLLTIYTCLYIFVIFG